MIVHMMNPYEAGRVQWLGVTASRSLFRRMHGIRFRERTHIFLISIAQSCNRNFKYPLVA